MTRLVLADDDTGADIVSPIKVGAGESLIGAFHPDDAVADVRAAEMGKGTLSARLARRLIDRMQRPAADRRLGLIR